MIDQSADVAKQVENVVEGMGKLSDSIGDKALKEIQKKWGKKGVEAFRKAADKG